MLGRLLRKYLLDVPYTFRVILIFVPCPSLAPAPLQGPSLIVLGVGVRVSPSALGRRHGRISSLIMLRRLHSVLRSVPSAYVKSELAAGTLDELLRLRVVHRLSVVTLYADHDVTALQLTVADSAHENPLYGKGTVSFLSSLETKSPSCCGRIPG
jgi:hypothetical protein